MTTNQRARIIAPIWDDQAASRVAVIMSDMTSEALKLSAMLTSRGKYHEVLMQIADVYRAIDDALEAVERLEKQVRGGKPTTDERRAVAKVKAGLRPKGAKR